MRNLDRIDFCFGQCLGDLSDLVRAILMAHGMATIAECCINNPYFSFLSHLVTPIVNILRAMDSAAANAAEVIISKLPAYLGRKSPAPSTSTIIVTRFSSNMGGCLSR